jgi:hypothetical protein
MEEECVICAERIDGLERLYGEQSSSPFSLSLCLILSHSLSLSHTHTISSFSLYS